MLTVSLQNIYLDSIFWQDRMLVIDNDHCYYYCLPCWLINITGYGALLLVIDFCQS